MLGGHSMETPTKPIVKQKPKPPPYPRPIPHFVVEELPPRPADIAWSLTHGGGHYSDEEPAPDDIENEKRAAKRRRIEACAEAYLRGEPLHIMTATLKGPFNKSWKNPWNKRRKTVATTNNDVSLSIEIPETTRKIPSSVDESRVTKLPGSTLQVQSSSSPSHRDDLKIYIQAVEHAPSPFTSKPHRLTHETSPQIPVQPKEKQVEAWLKTNSTYATASEVLVNSSPTPPTRRRATPGLGQHDPRPRGPSQSEPPRALTPKMNSPRTAVSLHSPDRSGLLGAEKRVQKLSRDMQTMMSEPVVQSAPELQDEVRTLMKPESSSKNVHDPSRAESAISKSKRSGLQTLPAAAHMSPFEFRRVSENTYNRMSKFEAVRGAKEHSLESGNGVDSAKLLVTVADPVQEVFATAPQAVKQLTAKPVPKAILAEPLGEKEVEANISRVFAPLVGGNHPPVSSHAASELATEELMPSAQHIPEQVQSLSSATRDGRLDSIKRVTSVTEQTDKEAHDQLEKTAPEVLDILANTEGPDSHVQQKERAPDVTAVKTPLPAFRAADLDTQEMLANIEPLDMSTIKILKDARKKDSPTTATKARSDKKRKKTSFALDPLSTSSVGSIKDVMKAKVSKTLGSPPSFTIGKDDWDVKYSDEENESQRKRSRRPSNTSKPKSILKSTNPTSSPGSLKQSRIVLSSGQDGQQGNVVLIASGQNGLGEDNFDLDGAIDDLGSFLGTWDPEKEASSLNIDL